MPGRPVTTLLRPPRSRREGIHARNLLINIIYISLYLINWRALCREGSNFDTVPRKPERSFGPGLERRGSGCVIQSQSVVSPVPRRGRRGEIAATVAHDSGLTDPVLAGLAERCRSRSFDPGRKRQVDASDEGQAGAIDVRRMVDFSSVSAAGIRCRRGTGGGAGHRPCAPRGRRPLD